MEQALVDARGRLGDGDSLKTLFRVAHTIKGNAASLGFAELAEITHEIEDVLDRLRTGSLAMSRQVTDLLLASVDTLREIWRRRGMTIGASSCAKGCGRSAPPSRPAARTGRARARPRPVGGRARGPRRGARGQRADAAREPRDARPHARPDGRDRRRSRPPARGARPWGRPARGRDRRSIARRTGCTPSCRSS